MLLQAWNTTHVLLQLPPDVMFYFQWWFFFEIYSRDKFSEENLELRTEFDNWAERRTWARTVLPCCGMPDSPDCNSYLRPSEKLTPLCRIGVRLKAPSEPHGILLSWCTRGFSRAFNWFPMMLKGVEWCRLVMSFGPCRISPGRDGQCIKTPTWSPFLPQQTIIQ